MSKINNIFIGGEWRKARSVEGFTAIAPSTGKPCGEHFPVSDWADVDEALAHAHAAAGQLRGAGSEQIAKFLETYAAEIEARATTLGEIANLETGLPIKPRLVDVELPRTTDQLRQAATAARSESWRHPVIDTAKNIRSMFAPIGPVAVFGPNNFPFAFNAISGGDFAAAIASKNPVIARAHPLQPGTTKLLCEAVYAALQKSTLPAGTVQLLYGMSNETGEKMIRDKRLAAAAFTGSRKGGLALKRIADEAGKPIYLEMSSINPVVMLPGALEENTTQLVEQYVSSCLLGCGQFCTKPGILLLVKSAAADRFCAEAATRFDAANVGTLFSDAGRRNLVASIQSLRGAGAEVAVGGDAIAGESPKVANTLLRTTGKHLLSKSEALQAEAFGNASMIVVCDDLPELVRVIGSLEGQLTGTIYSSSSSRDDLDYAAVEQALRPRVGRLINDKMPTGVAVSPAMHHGGPFPSSGHAGFTSVGIPASIRRFTQLQCYDGIKDSRLPDVLKNANPLSIWRYVDGNWTIDALAS